MPENPNIPFPPGRSESFAPEMSDADAEQLQKRPELSLLRPNVEAKLPLFLSILRHDTRVRRYKENEIILRQGDYGNSAFVVLAGEVCVVLRPHLPPSKLGRRETRRKGVLRTIAQLWNGLREPESFTDSQLERGQIDARRGDFDEVRVFLQDVPRIIKLHETAKMGSGELFGEISALSRTPRTATVFADGDVEVLEIRWQGLRDLKKNAPEFDVKIRGLLREHGVSSYLQALPELFGNLSGDQLKELAKKTEFVEKGDYQWSGEFKKSAEAGTALPEQEQIIAQEGDYPNGVYVVRSGFVRMSVKYGKGRRTLSYLGAGRYFGFQEVAHNWRHRDAQVDLQHTYSAAGYAHLMFIPTIVMEQLVLPSMPVRALPEPIGAAEITSDDGRSLRGKTAADRLGGGLVEFLAENRFFNGTATMVIDLDRCTRCDDCVRACAATHDNNPRFLRHGPTEGRIMVANACMHCADPVCMIGCPTGAIHRKGTGPVTINPVTCIGCEICANQCPYDAIRMVEIRDKRGELRLKDNGKPELRATKCDLCMENHGGPACQRACPHGALVRMNMHDFDSLADWLKR